MKEAPMTISESVEKQAKSLQINQTGIVDSSTIVFITAVKAMNPTMMQAVGNILNDVLNELMQTASLYQMEIKNLLENEGNWEAVSANLTAYSSVIAYLKSLTDKLEIIDYYMDKRVPECFRPKSS